MLGRYYRYCADYLPVVRFELEQVAYFFSDLEQNNFESCRNEAIAALVLDSL